MNIQTTTIVKGILLRDQQVLLAHRAPDRTNYPNSWSFPGGHVEAGDTPRQAMVRELQEEVGVTDPKAIHLCDMQDAAKLVTFHLYVVREWSGIPRNLGHEHDQLKWFDLSDAKQLEGLTFEAYRDLFVQLLNET